MVLLRPREGRPPPDPVASASYFSAAELDRARRFRRGQRALGLAASAIEARRCSWPPPAAPSAGRAAVGGRPRPGGRRLGAGGGRARARGRRRDPAAGRARPPAGARGRPRDPGLARLGGRPRQGLGARRRAGGGRRGGHRRAAAARRPALVAARAPASRSGAAGLGAVVAPLLLEPLFLHFAPLEDEALRADVLDLADAAGVTVGSVLVADASRGRPAANAYVSGLGRPAASCSSTRCCATSARRRSASWSPTSSPTSATATSCGRSGCSPAPSCPPPRPSPTAHAAGSSRAPRPSRRSRWPPGRSSVAAGPERGAAVAGGRGPRADRDALRLAGGAEAFVAFHRRHRRSRTSASPTRRAGPG